MKGRTDRPEGENMKNLRTLVAGFVLAAGIAFMPTTVFAAEDAENNLPAMEVVEETTEVAKEEVVFSIPTVETVDTTEEVPAVEEEVVEEAASTADTTEIVAGDVEVPASDEEVVEEADADSTITPVADEATAADAANAESTDDSASADETVTGRQVGTANNGYAEMSDGSDAFCVEQEKDHVEDGVEYTREDDVNGSQFNNIFVARQEAIDSQELSKEDINKITQLAIWAVLSNESYEDLVNFYYHESGVDLYNKMFQAHEGDWTFKYWSYTPSSDMFQKLISGQASKVVTPDEPETPEVPETPEEPEEPVVPDKPEEPVVPDEPETPEVPETPEEPSTPDVPEVPSEEPSTPVEDTVVPQEPVVLSDTFEAPVVSNVPVLSARMASTDDTTNMAARMAVIFAMAAIVVLLVKKENI